MRTARVELRVSVAQRRRLFGLLKAGGDVWAALIEVNRPGSVDTLSRSSVIRRGVARSRAWRPGSCRRQRSARWCAATRVPVVRSRSANGPDTRPTIRAGNGRSSRCVGTRAPSAWRATECGCRWPQAPPCWLRLCRPIPYPTGSLRSVTLLVDTGALVLDVTAGLEVNDHDIDPDRVAGVDLGIIHPIAARSAEQALLVSGRALRAEDRLHLADTKARQRKMAPKQPRARSAGLATLAPAPRPPAPSVGRVQASRPPSPSRSRPDPRGLGHRPAGRRPRRRRPSRDPRGAISGRCTTGDCAPGGAPTSWVRSPTKPNSPASPSHT